MELSFENLQVGQTFPVAEFCVQGDHIRRYAEATGDDHPSYRSGDDESLQAPNTFGHLFAVPRVVVPDAVLPPGGVHARQEYRFERPLQAGQRITTAMRLVDKYEKRGRRYLVYEFEVRDETGAVSLVSRMTSIAPR